MKIRKEVILKAPERYVRVRRDPHGVPVIQAGSVVDSSYGLGWVHARDRQLQSLLGREMLRGRLAEKFMGSRALINSDTQIRQLNILPDPEDEIADLEPDTREWLQAYADGFSSYLAHHKPVFELRLMGYHPEPWRIEDTFLLAKCFGFFGGPSYQVAMEKLLLQMIQKGIAEDRIRELFVNLQEPFDPALVDILRKVKLRNPAVSPHIPWSRTLPHSRASNNWAVSGGLTASGKPLLCGDIHQEVARMPNIWQEVVLVLPANRLMGATIPGVPGLIVGRTDHIAWSPTTTMMDVVDLRIEEVEDGKYRRGDGWKDLGVRREQIRVKGGKTLEAVFYETDRGCLEGDPTEDGYYLVQDWSIKRKAVASDFNAIIKINSAGSVKEAMDQFKIMSAASFNWVVADTAGNIGYQMSGRMHKKPEGVSGLMALPAWEEKYDPEGFVDRDDLPSLYNPPSGFIATANNDLNHLGRCKPINLPDSSTRADRIGELLKSGPPDRRPLDVEDMKRMQQEVFSPKAERFLRVLQPLLRGILGGGDGKHVFKQEVGKAKRRRIRRNAGILADWDSTYDANSRGATLFQSVHACLVHQVFGPGGFGSELLEFMNRESFLLSGLTPRFDEILLAESSSWFDARTRDELCRRAIIDGLSIRAVPFKRKRRIAFRHLLYGGILPSFLGFDYGPVALPGGKDSLFIGKFYGSPRGKTADGPVYRLIVDLAREGLRSNMPGGPTDRRFSRWYKSEMENWFRGVYKLLK